MVLDFSFEGQVLSVMIVALLVACMHVERRRIESDLGYRVEVFNEFSLIVLSCIMIGYAMCAGDGRALIILGWIHIVYFLLCITINFCVFFYKALIKQKLWCKHRFCKRQSVQNLKNRF